MTARSSGVLASMRRIAEGRLKKGVVDAATPGKNGKNIAAFFHAPDATSVSAKERIHRHADSDATSDHVMFAIPLPGTALPAASASATDPANTVSRAIREWRAKNPFGRR